MAVAWVTLGGLASPLRAEPNASEPDASEPDAPSPAEAPSGFGPEDYVRVVLEAPGPTPFHEIRYEVVRRGPAAAAMHRRELPGHGESLHGMALLTRDEEAALRALIDRAGALTLPDAPALPAQPGAEGLQWRVELSLDGRTHRFRVRDPINQPDRRYWALVGGVRDVVRRHAGEQPFRNVFFDPGHLGWVNLVSVPAARVWVDGFDTRLETPLYGYELRAGAHEVRLVSLDGAWDRTYTIRVEPGGTTHLAVDLR